MVEKEQGIIGQEIRMCEDDPSRCVLFNLLQGMYHKHPVRIDIAGTVESISHITADLLYRCYGQYYNLHNMVLAVAGRITPAEVEEAADKLLKPAPAMLPVSFSCDEPDTVVQHRVEQTMPVAAPLFYLGIKEPAAAPRDAKGLAGAQLLTDLLVGRSSPLYARLMEDGLINEQFEAEYFNGPGFGVWLFIGESSDPDRVAAAILDEVRRQQAAGLDPEGRDDILSEVKEYHKKTGTTVLLVSHSMEDIAKYANRVLVMSNKKIAMYDTVEKVFARAPELLELGLSVPQVTKIFLKLREMGVDVPADVYTIPYAVKTLLEAKRRRDAGESLVLPRSAARKGGAV